jgi:hypothetical protein
MARCSALLLVACSICFAESQPFDKTADSDFLRSARIVAQKDLSLGITNSKRLTLTDGQRTHDAHLQSINEAKHEFQGQRGTELNFKDCWKFNIAAYELAEMLGIDFMVPLSIERTVHGASSSVTWWIDNVMMDEAQRMKKRTQPPNLSDWNQQMWILRVFDQLIHNTDRNLQNMVIDKDWGIWMIDHTRAFRISRDLPSPQNLQRCDRTLLAKMKALNEQNLTARLNRYCTRDEIRGILARRDKIVSAFANKGESALYDISPALTQRTTLARASN